MQSPGSPWAGFPVPETPPPGSSPGNAVSHDTFIEKLKGVGIGVSVHFIPLHTMPFYKNRYQFSEEDFPETMKSYRREISLPIWPGMTRDQVERVTIAVKGLGY